MTLFRICVFALSGIMISCSYSEFTKKEVIEYLDIVKLKDIENLPGQYSTLPYFEYTYFDEDYQTIKDTFKYESPIDLWFELRKFENSNYDYIFKKNNIDLQIRIEFKNDQEMKLTLISDKRRIDEFIVKGIKKGRFFALKTKQKYMPYVPFYYVNRREVYYFAVAENNDLVLYKGFDAEGMVIGIGANNHYREIRKFRVIIENLE